MNSTAGPAPLKNLNAAGQMRSAQISSGTDRMEASLARTSTAQEEITHLSMTTKHWDTSYIYSIKIKNQMDCQPIWVLELTMCFQVACLNFGEFYLLCRVLVL